LRARHAASSPRRGSAWLRNCGTNKQLLSI
jgi:hypothetical protein